jgi:hypothetical protein
MIMTRGKVKAIKSGLFAAVLVLVASSASYAGPLGISTIEPYPDINVGFLSTTYNATTGAFASNGWALTLTQVGGTKLNITTNFSLTATVNKDTGAFSGGTLTIGSAAAPLLKSVNLRAFDYDETRGGALEFLFESPTGAYTTPNNPTGGVVFDPTLDIDVTLLPGSGFLGNWASSWSSSGGTADARTADYTDGTPEPSSILLTLLGAAGLGALRRRKTAVPVPTEC